MRPAVPTGVHWYNWYERLPSGDGFAAYPDFLARVGFVEAVGKVRQKGHRVMAYIAGGLWKTGSESWVREHAEELAALSQSEEFCNEYTDCG